MQSREGEVGTFSPTKKQSKEPQNLPSLIKSISTTSPFKFKFTPNTNPFTIKPKHHNYHSKQEDQTSHLKTMAALQRFKLLATQCGVAPSPTRSPRTSPLVHLRRRKTTLRMLLGRSKSSSCRSPSRRRDSSAAIGFSDRFRLLEAASREKAPVKRNSLKELFVSSPPPQLEVELGGRGNLKENRDELVQLIGNGKGESGGGVLTGLQGGPGSPRPVWSGFRYRSLLRKAWRPVLVSIPE